MRTQFRHQVVILVASLAVFFINLGGPRLWDEDETEYARCAREMMDRGDWIVPTFNYSPWSEKPAFVYWLMIGSFRVFGTTEFAARFPSALLAIGSALLTYQVGRRLFRPDVGLWAALIMITSLMFVVVGRAATLDSTLVFFTTLALLAWVACLGSRSWQEPGDAWNADGSAAPGCERLSVERFRALLPRSWWGFAAMYVPIALAVMVKGPIGVILPVLAIGLYVLVCGTVDVIRDGELHSRDILPRRNVTRHSPLATRHDPSSNRQDSAAGCRGYVKRSLRERVVAMAVSSLHYLRILAINFPAAAWAMRPVTLAAIVLTIALPWYVLVGLRTDGEYWWVFFWDHNVQYLLHPKQGHNGSILYYPIALTIGFFPWTMALGLGSVEVFKRIRNRGENFRACLLAVCWCGTWIAVFSLCGTKLPHYLAPAYPLFATIAGLWIADWIAAPAEQRAGRWIAGGWVFLALLGVATLIAAPPIFAKLAPGVPSYSWIGGILVFGSTLGWLFQWTGRRMLAAAALVSTAAALFIALFAVAAPPFSRLQTSLQITEMVERLGSPDMALGTFRVSAPGFIYYANRHEAIAGLKRAEDVLKLYARSAPGGNPPVGSRDDVYSGVYSGPPVTDAADFLLVTDGPGLSEVRPLLPPDTVVLERRPRFLKLGEIVIVGRRRLPIDGPNLANRDRGERK